MKGDPQTIEEAIKRGCRINSYLADKLLNKQRGYFRHLVLSSENIAKQLDCMKRVRGERFQYYINPKAAHDMVFIPY